LSDALLPGLKSETSSRSFTLYGDDSRFKNPVMNPHKLEKVLQNVVRALSVAGFLISHACKDFIAGSSSLHYSAAPVIISFGEYLRLATGASATKILSLSYKLPWLYAKAENI